MQSVFCRDVWECVLMCLQTRKDFLNAAMSCKTAGVASRVCRDRFADRFMVPDERLKEVGVQCYFMNGGRSYLHGPWFEFGRRKRALQFFSIGTRLSEYTIEDCQDLTPELALKMWHAREFPRPLKRAHTFNVTSHV